MLEIVGKSRAMSADATSLKLRFDRALSAAGATRAGDAVFDELVYRYAEAHRHYHTLAHVDACLAWLDWFCGDARHPEEVELALWFHDAVYDPRSHDNERRSGELARERLAAVGVPAGALDRITAHVLATEHHAATGGDGALVIDLDLTILGAPAPDFERFEAAIRREYAHVGDAAFTLGRRSILEGFLSKAEIYFTPKIREELEVRARTNLKRRIAELSRESAS
jgi:predicted metal-dependent HD superfamily phosphohydrolase